MNILHQAVSTQSTAASGSELVTVHGDDLVTTTMAIAIGTANTHESVIKLVRTYQGDFEKFGGVRFEIEPFNTPGGPQKREIALLNEDQAMLLIAYMRNSVIVRRFKIELVRSFGEMRRRLSAQVVTATPNFDDGIAMAYAWIEAKKEAQDQRIRADQESAQRQQLEHQVAELAPAAAGLDRIAKADDAMCVTDAAKTLQLAPRKLRDLLLEKKWMYPRAGKSGHVAYQDKIHAGYLKHKYGNYQDPESGEWKTSAQVLVTSRGIAKLSKILGTPPAPPSLDQRQLN